MSVQATPQRQSTGNAPSSPRTPRRSLTPLTKHALQMSTTPIRNRLLLTPTKNKQKQVYDPLDDLRMLGRLFNTKARSKSRVVPITKNVSPSKTTTSSSYKTPSPVPEGNTFPLGTDVSTNLSDLKRRHVSSPQLSISPVLGMGNVPSFINKDVRSFAKLFHQSSSFSTNVQSLEMSDSSGLLEETLQITQSQSQSHSQSQSQHQSQPLMLLRIPYNDEVPSRNVGAGSDEIPDFEDNNYIDNYNETFESHADTSNIALPEAILRDGSGILGMSDDELEEYNLSLSKLNESGSDSRGDSDSDTENEGDANGNSEHVRGLVDTDELSKELSLIKSHEQFITKRKQRRKTGRMGEFTSGQRPIIKDAMFSNKMIKGLLDNLQLGDTIESGLDASLFNEMAYRFIDMELMKTIEMSELTGLGDRIVHTEVFYGDSEKQKEEDEEEGILLYAMHNWDMEKVKELEGVLYSNKAVRKRRAEYNLLKRKELAHKKVQQEVEQNSEEINVEAEEDIPGDEVDLKDLDTHIMLRIANYSDDMDDSSDYEIPFAEEEEEE